MQGAAIRARSRPLDTACSILYPDSVRKVLYLAIRKASARWARPIKDWVAALNHFTMALKGRVPNR